MNRLSMAKNLLLVLACGTMPMTHGWVSSTTTRGATPTTFASTSSTQLYQSTEVETAVSFIDTELRGAAMKLHTRAQAPKEGKAEAPAPPKEPYTTTHADYLRFLVDSQHVYQALEEIVNAKEELAVFRETGLERATGLETDIAYMMENYALSKPDVKGPGLEYAQQLRSIESTPEFMCHFYNFYFAHTAGGRMIGKQMSALLLEKHTLEFYKWDGDLNEIKARVKASIEDMAAAWSPEQRGECVDATAECFRLAGAINQHLGGKFA